MKKIVTKQQLVSKPTESKEDVFRRVMDKHVSFLRDRYRKMRRTMNAHRISSDNAELICIAVEQETSKFISIVKSRIEDEQEAETSIWQ